MTNPIADAVLAEKALDWEDDIITPLLESQEATPITTAFRTKIAHFIGILKPGNLCQAYFFPS